MQQQFIDDYFKQNKNNSQQLRITARKPPLATSNTDGNTFKNSIMQQQQQQQQASKRGLSLSNQFSNNNYNINNNYIDEPQQKYFAYDENKNVMPLLGGINDDNPKALQNQFLSETVVANSRMKIEKSPSKWAINSKERTNNNNNNNNNKIQLDNQLRTVAGTVEKILKYKELAGNIDIIYELFSDVVNVRKGKKEYENILLLRNNNSGPVLQAIYYEIDCKFPLIFTGDSVRCIGKFIGNSRFNIMKITKNTLPNTELIKRLENIGTYILNKENRQISYDF